MVVLLASGWIHIQRGSEYPDSSSEHCFKKLKEEVFKFAASDILIMEKLKDQRGSHLKRASEIANAL